MDHRTLGRTGRAPMVRLLLPLLLLLALTGCAGGSEIANLIEGESVGAVEVVDVRTPEEYAAGHVEGAVNIDSAAEDLREQLDALPRDRYYVVYCATGRRAAGVVDTMRSLGFGSVVNGGGYDDLVDQGVPTER